MRCRPGDIVMVIRSEVGNDGRIGRIVGHAQTGSKLANGVLVYESDDWIVDGRFNVADECVMTIFDQEVAVWEANRHEVLMLPFPDSWLRPIRGDELPAEVSKPETAEA